jgi:phosphoribosyl 1,2-cyclic phosphodiesterase
MPGSNPAVSNAKHTISENNLDTNQGHFLVKFWGVRGSIPSPGTHTIHYGGNTACVEVIVNDTRIVFDGGTGLRILGERLLNAEPIEGHLFFTHTHWDRIQGFPFFIPAFHSQNRFHIYGAVGLNGASIKQRLTDQMLRPNFPVPLQMMKSELEFHDIEPGTVIPINDIFIETISLNRHNGALGYRVTWAGYSVVYATDTDHSCDNLDEGMMYLAQQSDVLIFDAAYADHAYYDISAAESSHSTHVWRKSIEAALTTQAKKIVMFHHDPSHDDIFLERVEREMQIDYPNVCMAREGMVITLC